MNWWAPRLADPRGWQQHTVLVRLQEVNYRALLILSIRRQVAPWDKGWVICRTIGQSFLLSHASLIEAWKLFLVAELSCYHYGFPPFLTVGPLKKIKKNKINLDCKEWKKHKLIRILLSEEGNEASQGLTEKILAFRQSGDTDNLTVVIVHCRISTDLINAELQNHNDFFIYFPPLDWFGGIGMHCQYVIKVYW